MRNVIAWIVVVTARFYRTTDSNKIEVIVFTAVASNRRTEALASVISFTFVVYSHYKHSSCLGRELNHGQIASVISLPWTLPQS